MLRDPEELTETERAQQRAARSASEDLRAAVDSGDSDEKRAALGQLLQTLGNMDPQSTRDKLHIPDDAGEYRDSLVAILQRIPPNWGRWISCSKGWCPITIALGQALAEIDPDYELHQAKEKLGGLRYYFRTRIDGAREQMNALVRAAEEQAAATFELYGEPVVRHSNGRGWIMTLCAACATERGYGRIGGLVNDPGPDHRGVWRVTDYAGDESIWDLTNGGVHHRLGTVSRCDGARACSAAGGCSSRTATSSRLS